MVVYILVVGAGAGEGREGGAGEEGTGQVADRGYDCREVVSAVPETVIRGLIAEDLGKVLIRRVTPFSFLFDIAG